MLAALQGKPTSPTHVREIGLMCLVYDVKLCGLSSCVVCVCDLQFNPYSGLSNPRFTARCSHIQSCIDLLPIKVLECVRVWLNVHLCLYVHLCVFEKMCVILYISWYTRSCMSSSLICWPMCLAMTTVQAGSSEASVQEYTLTSTL